MTDRAELPARLREEWRPVVGYPRYQVSSAGHFIGPKGKMKPAITRYGYLKVTLYTDDWHEAPARRFAHRLVLEAFVGPCPDGMEAAHLDGNRQNNVLSNLIWTDHSTNIRHQYEHGTKVMGERCCFSKLKLSQVRVIRAVHSPGDPVNGTAALARRFGVNRTAIQKILRGGSWAFDLEPLTPESPQ